MADMNRRLFGNNAYPGIRSTDARSAFAPASLATRRPTARSPTGRPARESHRLLEPLAALVKHAEQLAIETELVDAARPGVDAVEHLVRPRRDADGPGRTRRGGTGPDLRTSARRPAA